MRLSFFPFVPEVEVLLRNRPALSKHEIFSIVSFKEDAAKLTQLKNTFSVLCTDAIELGLSQTELLVLLKPNFEPWQQRKSYAPEDLKTQINHMIIILEPLVCETMHKMRNFFYPITKYTPKFLSTANLYHASIFVYKNSKDNGILAEFGIYNKLREGDHSSLVHYYNDEENGLRYAKYNFYTLQNELSSETITIECETPFFVGLERLFEKCVADAHKKFKSNDYNLLSSNCQYFVAKAIK